MSASASSSLPFTMSVFCILCNMSEKVLPPKIFSLFIHLIIVSVPSNSSGNLCLPRRLFSRLYTLFLLVFSNLLLASLLTLSCIMPLFQGNLFVISMELSPSSPSSIILFFPGILFNSTSLRTILAVAEFTANRHMTARSIHRRHDFILEW
ncbi:unnamed protein product [Mesocestoides corti]|uniref:Uncharacterized protein n=2 Tax=Mesocestoides corti TaxID=53468 RepID=A0A0R3U2V4_MESCO|nr:unnamed protein product [Mesocestoides corti]